MEPCVVGIDGGGTTTRAAVLDRSGQLRGVGRGGPSNYDDVGEEGARENIDEAVREAQAQAGLEERPFAAAFLGLAGIVSEEDRTVVRRIAQTLELAAPEHVGAGHDARAALAGALNGRPGVVLIAGTGSSCYGRTVTGESWMAGGWGALLADEGSGYWLGVEAMTAAVRAHDGRGPETVLRRRVEEYLELEDLNKIMHRVYVDGLSRTETAALAPLVFEAARAGDEGAQALLRRGAGELAASVQAVAERLGMAGNGFELARVGGLWQAGAVYAGPFEAAVRERLPRCQFVPTELPPTLGAGLLALRKAGREVNESTERHLRCAAESWPHVPAGEATPYNKLPEQPT
jgi:N-acetylglucosamine kinase-like BadF-type ATPase